MHVSLREPYALLVAVLKGTLFGVWAGVASGSASALFLMSLSAATRLREQNGWLLWLLPLSGVAVGLLYHRFGSEVEAGGNLLLERVHTPDAQVPFRMVPLILMGTILTHLCGGSAGREGTAVQMGGTLANTIRGVLRLSPADHRLLIMSGMSGGFGSVFGTPLAGTVFGLEVLSVGRIQYDGLLACFVASVSGDLVCRAWGVQHPLYPTVPLPPGTVWLWLCILAAGTLFAGASYLFGELTHAVQSLLRKGVSVPWLRPLFGGLAVIGLTLLVGTRDYLGLSLPLIERSFTPEGVVSAAFLLKIIFTAVTLGSGFKGGEVTPLFCIGATLGAAFARWTGQPTAFFAALGFAAVFAGAANTPLACILMGIELFGAAIAVPLTAACLLSYLLTGHRGIYLSQRVAIPKSPALGLSVGMRLHDLRHPHELRHPPQSQTHAPAIEEPAPRETGSE